MTKKPIARCPFCSSRKAGVRTSRDNTFWVDCTSRRCGASGPLATTEAGAIKRWGNQRAHVDMHGGQPSFSVFMPELQGLQHAGIKP